MRRALIGAAAAAVILVVMAVPAGAGGGGGHCASPDYAESVSGPAAVVEMKGACFSPTVLYVGEGTEVTFVNRDPFVHHLSGPAGTFAEGLFQEFKADSARSAEAAQTFLLQSPGVFPYMCYLHPGMAGAIVVGDGGLAANGLEVDQVSTGAGGSTAGGSSTPSLLLGLGIAGVLLIAAIASLATRGTQEAATGIS